VIGRKFSTALYSSGVTSIDVLDRLIAQAVADPSVSALLLAIDSPGGHAQGVPDVSASIQQARQSKPVLAYVDGRAQSGGYWLAAQAEAEYAMSSSDVGSIGAYMAFLDMSRMAEMKGIKPEVFKSGKHKAMGMAGTSLTDEQRGMIQTRVDAWGAQFRETVQAGRGGRVPSDAMQGQSFSAVEAMGIGLVDSIATLGEAMRDAARLGEMRAMRQKR
jgi:protease-4